MSTNGNIKLGKGSIEMLTLYLLSSGEKYGLEISETISEMSNNKVQVPGGSLYPSLYRLEEKGYISEEKRTVGKRKVRSYYTINERGKEYLKELIDDYIKTNDGVKMILNIK